ncbi:MAG: NAD(P)/FAD-dependent oxidoreductase [Verrucomicrobiales bacterium]|nr:NAD(P)/FAD-dependent oxidoreductase [Verrucomicrobiales bacterium]
MGNQYDAVIIGSGPNGLSAAVRIAQEGKSVLVIEGHALPGGGTRTAELTLPGFKHDVCSAIHPMGVASPFFRTLPLGTFGLEWIHPEIPLAHPFEDCSAAVLHRSMEETALQFDSDSARNYRRLFGPLLPHFDDLLADLLAPPKIPSHPIATMSFGCRAIPSALEAARLWFRDEKMRALLVGNAAHSLLPLDRMLSTNAIGLMLMLAGHAAGWPLAKGGSCRITEALVGLLKSLGGELETGRSVRVMADLPKAKVYLFDTSPRALADIAGNQLPGSYRETLSRYRHAPGIFKIDYALSEAVPWKNDACLRAGTVHLGGSLDEMVQSEREVNRGIHPERPFVLTAQQSLFDDSRAPAGKHTFWAYCHVPAGSEIDMTDGIEGQIERFAPGFRELVLARHRMNCAVYERYNPNLVGGDIVGGATDWRQLMTRPAFRMKPHTTPNPAIYLCSASTPPGGGVHGMCGYWAAGEALKTLG